MADLSVSFMGIEKWMDGKEYASINNFKGKMSREKLGQKDSRIYKRTQYIRMLMQTSESLMKQIS